jgi:hypothetical protein
MANSDWSQWSAVDSIPDRRGKHGISVLNRQAPHTATAVLDDHDRAGIERDGVRAQDLNHKRGNSLGSLISRPDQNHTRDRASASRQQIAEIQVACHDLFARFTRRGSRMVSDRLDLAAQIA